MLDFIKATAAIAAINITGVLITMTLWFLFVTPLP